MKIELLVSTALCMFALAPLVYLLLVAGRNKTFALVFALPIVPSISAFLTILGYAQFTGTEANTSALIICALVAGICFLASHLKS